MARDTAQLELKATSSGGEKVATVMSPSGRLHSADFDERRRTVG